MPEVKVSCGNCTAYNKETKCCRISKDKKKSNQKCGNFFIKRK